VPSASKNKGSAFEREIVQYLREHGWAGAERTRAGWVDDRGDIDGVVGVTFECKNQKVLALASWVDELVVEMQHGNNNVGAVVHKRRGVTNPSDYYATLPLSVFVHLLKEAGF
jgi:hypothetical protein